MIAIISLLLVIAISLLAVKIGAQALMLTGLSSETARFQARSAFSGVGFTTCESESVVNHPVRRRIIMLMMLMGNLGVATVVAGAVMSVLSVAESPQWWQNLLLLLAGVLTLYWLSSSGWAERGMNRLILRGLKKWSRLEVRDYVALLQLRNGFAVTETKIEPGDWLAGKSLREAALSAEGVLVLGIQRADGFYLGSPHGAATIKAGDTLVLYGMINRLEELDQRRQGLDGDAAHRSAVSGYSHEQGENGELGAR